MWLIVYSNDHAPLTVRPIYSSSKLRTAQMMIFSLVAMIGLEKCCITSACLQWLCHSGERTVARGPLVMQLLRVLFLYLSHVFGQTGLIKLCRPRSDASEHSIWTVLTLLSEVEFFIGHLMLSPFFVYIGVQHFQSVLSVNKGHDSVLLMCI